MELEHLNQFDDGSRVWAPGIVACIVRFVSANEIACTIRLVDKVTSLQFEDSKTVWLSLPSPAYAFRERWGIPGAVRNYTQKQRVEFLCLTAASGSIENLEIVLDGAGLLLEVALASAGLDVMREVLEAAAAACQLEVCQLLRGRGCPWGRALS